MGRALLSMAWLPSLCQKGAFRGGTGAPSLCTLLPCSLGMLRAGLGQVQAQVTWDWLVLLRGCNSLSQVPCSTLPWGLCPVPPAPTLPEAPVAEGCRNCAGGRMGSRGTPENPGERRRPAVSPGLTTTEFLGHTTPGLPLASVPCQVGAGGGDKVPCPQGSPEQLCCSVPSAHPLELGATAASPMGKASMAPAHG